MSNGQLAGIPWNVNSPDLVDVVMVLLKVVEEVAADIVEEACFVEVGVEADGSLVEIKAELGSDQCIPPFLGKSLPATCRYTSPH